ncbi:MAG: hypothetical protein K2N73_14095 [Lachnospiraceae bacterium]|nr:hypothetical protein [Lachnospiraceae bacterium]
MCMTIKEMNETMQAIKEWERVKEEAEANITSLKAKAIEFLNETEECEAVDKKGNPIRKFIGTLFKATYSPQERETVDKEEVKKLLSKEDYAKVSSVSRYSVLRIS